MLMCRPNKRHNHPSPRKDLPMRQFLLVAALLVTLFNTVLSVGSAAVMDETLVAHNTIRQQVAQAESQRLGGTVSIPDLAWDPVLAALAQDWANQVIGPNPPPHRPADQRPGIGANTFWSYSVGAPVNQSVAAAMQFSASEQQYYDYDTNSCAAGQDCGHYTQVVWSTTTHVGCGSALWNAGGAEYVVWVCNYSPAGNLTINGEKATPVQRLWRCGCTYSWTRTLEIGAQGEDVAGAPATSEYRRCRSGSRRRFWPCHGSGCQRLSSGQWPGG